MFSITFLLNFIIFNDVVRILDYTIFYIFVLLVLDSVVAVADLVLLEVIGREIYIKVDFLRWISVLIEHFLKGLIYILYLDLCPAFFFLAPRINNGSFRNLVYNINLLINHRSHLSFLTIITEAPSQSIPLTYI